MEKTFKILILIEIILIAASIASEFALRGTLPEELRTFLNRTEEDMPPVKTTFVGLLLLVLVLFVVSWIMMWRLKSAGRTLYAVSWGLSLLFMIPLGPYVQPAFTYSLDQLSVLVSGVILGVAYFSELRFKFT
jgi:hypothetical protein